MKVPIQEVSQMENCSRSVHALNEIISLSSTKE